MSPFNALNPWDGGLAAGRLYQSPLQLLDTPEIESRGSTAPPLSEEGMVSPLRTHQDTQFGQGASLSGGQVPLR